MKDEQGSFEGSESGSEGRDAFSVCSVSVGVFLASTGAPFGQIHDRMRLVHSTRSLGRLMKKVEIKSVSIENKENSLETRRDSSQLTSRSHTTASTCLPSAQSTSSDGSPLHLEV